MILGPFREGGAGLHSGGPPSSKGFRPAVTPKQAHQRRAPPQGQVLRGCSKVKEVGKMLRLRVLHRSPMGERGERHSGLPQWVKHSGFPHQRRQTRAASPPHLSSAGQAALSAPIAERRTKSVLVALHAHTLRCQALA